MSVMSVPRLHPRFRSRYARNDKVVRKASSAVQNNRPLHHAPGLGFALGDQFGVHAAKGLGHMTIPAHWTVSGKHRRKLLGAQVFPLDRFMVRAEQRRGVIEGVEFAEGFVAEDTLLIFIPFGDDVPDQAVFKIYFELL